MLKLIKKYSHLLRKDASFRNEVILQFIAAFFAVIIVRMFLFLLNLF